MTSVLVIEDDGVIARAVSAHLRHAGFEVEWVDDGERGIRKLRFERPDICIVDLMRPTLDGWGLIEQARREGLVAPILVISARGAEHDKVAALQMGADDYLAKPFGMAELVARVQALVRRSRVGPADHREEPIEVAGLVLDPSLHQAFLLVDGIRKNASLTPTEFRLAWTLARNPGRAMSRDELQQRVWGVPHRHRDRTVDVCVRKLREKLDRRTAYDYVHTHYGIGYRFAAELRDGVLTSTG